MAKGEKIKKRKVLVTPVEKTSGKQVNVKTSKHNSIAARLIISITLLSSILVISLGLSIYFKVKELNSDQFTQRYSSSTIYMDQCLLAFFTGYNDTLSLMANVGNRDEDTIRSFSDMIFASNDNIATTAIIHSDGSIISSSEISDYQKQILYEGAVDNGGDPYYTTLYVNANNEVVVGGAKSFENDNGETDVAAIEINAAAFVEIFGDETTMGSIKYIMIDSNANVVLNPYVLDIQFKSVNEIGIEALNGYIPGEYITREGIVEGIPSEIRFKPSSNDYMSLDYAIIIPKTEINASTNAVQTLMAILLIVSVLVSFIIALLIAQGISKTLTKITKMLYNISQGDGDLSVRLPILSKDEVGNLCQSFNITMEKIANSIKSIVNQTNNMKTMGESLSSNMSSSASAIEEIDENVANINYQVINQSAGVKQTSQTMVEIADNIAKLNDNIEIQSASVEQSTASVEEMVANINSVTEILEKNAISVKELSDSAAKGKELVKRSVDMTINIAEDSQALIETSALIRNIANQTNLLSMNAAIEAAHAGDAGAGFAVVADEIRKLAEDSNAQGKKINDVMKHLREMISDMKDSASQMQLQFDVIFNNTQTVSSQEGIIKNAMDEQSSGSKQVIDAIHQIHNITVDVKNSANQMEQGNKEVLVEMDKLSEVTLQIKTAMHEISSGIGEMNKSMQQINILTQENSASINKVSKEVNQFKTEAEIEKSAEPEKAKSEDNAEKTETTDTNEESSEAKTK
ncbi:MAG: HAMP domain-containing protein [Treponema sp.]|nr:HAMP domain-containing protein [Treponema sp.]